MIICSIFHCEAKILATNLHSGLLLHGDERSNVSSANRAELLSLDELLTAVLADAIVGAGHYQSILAIGQADEALSLWVVVLNRLLAFFGTLVSCHSVDRFEFEWQSIDL